MPAEADRDGGHDQRRDDGADVGAGVEDCGGRSALALGKPQGDRLDGRGEIAAFAEPQRDAREKESADAVDQGVPDGRDAPRGDRNRVADLRAEAVDEPAEEEEADRIGALERTVDVAELLVGPMQLVVEDRLDQGENLPVDIVDRRRKKQQAADDPAVVGGGGTRGLAHDFGG